MESEWDENAEGLGAWGGWGNRHKGLVIPHHKTAITNTTNLIVWRRNLSYVADLLLFLSLP